MNWKNATEDRLWGWFRALMTEVILSVVGLRYCLSFRFLYFELRRRVFFFLCSPWAVSRRFLDQRGETDAQGYGETPLVTLNAVARRLKLTSKDALLELGSGTGRNCVWLSDQYGCKTLGIEQIPLFVQVGKTLVRQCLPAGKVSFICGDMFDLDMSRWQRVYVDCTAMSESCIRQVAMLCAGLPNGAKVVSVNASFAQLMPERFQLESVFPGLFIWGWSDMRIQRVGPPEEENPEDSDVDSGILQGGFLDDLSEPLLPKTTGIRSTPEP